MNVKKLLEVDKLYDSFYVEINYEILERFSFFVIKEERFYM